MTWSAEKAAWWLRTATGDLMSARALLSGDDAPARNAAYLAHQVAEKALKASIAAGGTEPPWTHDLVGLRSRAPEAIRTALAVTAVKGLSGANPAGRYPEDVAELYERAEAEQLVADATTILNVVLVYLKSKGVDATDVEPA